MNDERYEELKRVFYQWWKPDPVRKVRIPKPVQVVGKDGRPLAKNGSKMVWHHPGDAKNAIHQSLERGEDSYYVSLAERREFIERMLNEGEITIKPID